MLQHFFRHNLRHYHISLDFDRGYAEKSSMILATDPIFASDARACLSGAALGRFPLGQTP
jgi:hypothetical protein